MRKIHLLLADKNLSYLEITKKMLMIYDDKYEVDFAISGKECVEKLLGNKYDILLLDYDLDDKKGLEVLDEVVKTGLTLPVVMLIEEGREDIADKAMEQGAYDYIMKVRGYLTALPFTIGKVLERRKLNQQPSVEKEQPSREFIEPPEFEEAYYILDKRGRFLSANKKLELLLGYSEEELLELTLSDLLPPARQSQYYLWMTGVDNGKINKPLQTDLLGKRGSRQPVELSMTPMKDHTGEVVSYKGKIRYTTNVAPTDFPINGRFDQVKMINEMVNAINTCFDAPLNFLLERITEIICQLFKFKRATLALLDRRRRVFVKQAMVGYLNENLPEKRALEVPQEFIEHIFADRFKIKVMYYNQDIEDGYEPFNPLIPERRTQRRRPNQRWHEKDIVLLNLTDKNNKTFGYISLDEPLSGLTPSREVFYNLEIFGKLASLAVENFYRFSTLEKRNRRLKQILVTSNIFKLHLSLNELLREIVWSVKFSFDFNLVALGLISKKTKKMEIKAVACDDKIKLLQLMELSFPLKALKGIFKKKYKKEKSYFVNQPEAVLRSMKSIYYDNINRSYYDERYWPWWATLVVPVRSRGDKIIGFLVADDPVDGLMPTSDTIHTLEILARQIAVAIENRVLYLQLKNRVFQSGKASTTTYKQKPAEGGLKKIVDKFLK